MFNLSVDLWYIYNHRRLEIKQTRRIVTKDQSIAPADQPKTEAVPRASSIRAVTTTITLASESHYRLYLLPSTAIRPWLHPREYLETHGIQKG